MQLEVAAVPVFEIGAGSVELERRSAFVVEVARKHRIQRGLQASSLLPRLAWLAIYRKVVSGSCAAQYLAKKLCLEWVDTVTEVSVETPRLGIDFSSLGWWVS